MNNILGPLATIVSLLGFVFGVFSIIKGSFRPQRMTRFLLFIISLLFVGTLIAQGDTSGIYVALAGFIGTTAMFIASIKNGIGGYSKLDIIVLICAIFTFVIWRTTDNALLGLIMSILTDLIGFIPTFVKTWNRPETEDWRFYLADVI